MSRLINFAIMLLGTFSILKAQDTDSIIGRPYKSFDVTAFCSYDSFHPSQYLTDNNWDVLCVFTTPGKLSKLDSLGIKASKSQIRLLEVGGLLKSDKGILTTTMPIFGKKETREIRNETKAFADSIYPFIEPEIKKLIDEFENSGFSRQSYSLIFSYLFDGIIWNDNRLTPSTQLNDHGTWSGVYWAMYENRAHDKTGTNGFGPVKVNWTNSLGYYPGTSALISFAEEIIETKGGKISNPDLIARMSSWGLVDTVGNLTVPVINTNNGDAVDVLCNSIADRISDAVKKHCASWAESHNIGSREEAEVIFYHEAMWDLLDLCEENGIVSVPAILKGEKVGQQHFGDITFIVIDESDN